MSCDVELPDGSAQISFATSLALRPRQILLYQFRAGTEYRAAQYADVSTKPPHLTLSHGSPFRALPLPSATLYSHYVQIQGPSHKKQNCGLRSWPRPTWSCRPSPAHLGWAFLPHLVMLCCGHLHFSSSARPHTRWSHFCPRKNNDAILVLVPRREINCLVSWDSNSKLFLPITVLEGDSSNLKDWFFSPVRLPCGEGLL